MPSDGAIPVTMLDPEGPRWRRWIVPLLCLTVAALSVLMWSVQGIAYAFFFAVQAAPFAPLVFRRRREGRAEVECGTGRIAVKVSRWPKYAIHARDIVGSRVLEEETTLALMLRGRRFPVVLRLPSGEALAKIREVLGIPRRGDGVLEWDLRVLRAEQLSLATRAVFAALLATGYTLNFTAPSSWGHWVGPGLMVVMPIMLATYVWARSATRYTLSLAPGAFLVRTPERLETAAHAEVAAIEISETECRLVRKDGRVVSTLLSGSRIVPHGLLAEDARALREFAAHELASSAPADETSHLAALERRNETTLEWLSRVDGIHLEEAAQAAYRGALSLREVWQTLSDPAARGDVRVAAARLLARDSAQRVRVAEVLPSIREDRLDSASRPRSSRTSRLPRSRSTRRTTCRPLADASAPRVGERRRDHAARAYDDSTPADGESSLGKLALERSGVKFKLQWLE